MTKTYKCICGKEFDNPQKFNGHKQGCEIHIINKYGSLETYYNNKNRNVSKASKTRINTNANKRLKTLLTWISEGHTCEKCGKVMTEKYSSGRFCCRSCANSHNMLDNSKQVISNSVLHTYKAKYYKKPSYCTICGKVIPYEIRHRKTCSDNCLKESFRDNALNNSLGGITKGHGNGISGVYKGIKCDSKYELAFVVYCLENDIDIIRNTHYFNYTSSIDGTTHKFYPDFYLPGKQLYVEIKGYYQENTLDKITAMNSYNVNFTILYWDSICKCLDFIKNNLGRSYHSLERLYDCDMPL